MNHAAGAHNQHDIGLCTGLRSPIEGFCRQHFTKPDHAGPHQSTTIGASHQIGAQLRHSDLPPTSVALVQPNVTMQAKHAVAAGDHMQPIDVLRNERETITQSGHLHQREVTGIGLHVEQALATTLVESPNQFGIPRERLRRGDILDPVIFPQSTVRAKRGYAALSRNPRAGHAGDAFGPAKRKNRTLDLLGHRLCQIVGHRRIVILIIDNAYRSTKLAAMREIGKCGGDLRVVRATTVHVIAAAIAIAATVSGCQQYWINSADTIANRIVQKRQQEALGQTSDFEVGDEHGVGPIGSSAYDFVPHPIDSEVPPAFRAATQPRPDDGESDAPYTSADDSGATTDADGNMIDPAAPKSTANELSTSSEPPITTDTATAGPDINIAALEDKPVIENATIYRLNDALAYAFRHARDFQSQKEDLYLAALSLMTERQLWTPQVVGEVSGQYANYGQVRDFDQAMTAVSELSATQRLPYGGEVAARVINTLMRDLGEHVTSGESGTVILEANIPLLRGAGRVAYESRYQSERNVIYAVRDFEGARRDLVVDVAGDFFDLLAAKTRIDSAFTAAKAAIGDLERSQALVDAEQIVQVEADRARVQYLNRSNDLINARVLYQSALDRFKVRIGMPTVEAIDVVDEDLNLYEPEVTQGEAIDTALKYRLELLNVLDAIDDAKRQVVIARNNFLPQLDISGRVSMDTDPDQVNSLSYNSERTLWQGFVTLELPIDRREERNVYRASLIDLRRAERSYDLGEDTVRLDVRDAIRRLEQARVSMEIQRENIRVNDFRRQQARALFERGRLQSINDLVDAENDFQDAQNQFAQALANYRLAILTFLRDSGTLRVSDDGKWL